MRASKAVDEIGVVVHGPEVVDLGFAEMAIDRLSDLGTVTAVLGGTMGRAAVIDGSLEDRIEISSRELPSRSVKRLDGACNFVLLLNYAKTRETGLAFGAMVAARARPNKPLLIADYGGGYITHLAGEGAGIAEKVAAVLELELVDPPRPPPRLETSGGGGQEADGGGGPRREDNGQRDRRRHRPPGDGGDIDRGRQDSGYQRGSGKAPRRREITILRPREGYSEDWRD
ncbi:MAG: hypothetical protein METHAR1v1_490006 [Methanothrix sp.]|nr:MAG: hypothetical protein METHAR1v1_490006 [Methanothrix sp.]